MNNTIAYYNEHAEAYFQKTVHSDMSYPYSRFTFYLAKGDRLLDLGCGSGRDALYFKMNGFQVDCMDGSEKMAALAEQYTGIHVKVQSFADLCNQDTYDGIFASASLLHVPFAQMEQTFIHVFQALKKEGILYASFQYGDKERDEECHYTDMNEERLLEVLKPHLEEWTVLELWHSHDALNRDKMWMNCILRRIR